MTLKPRCDAIERERRREREPAIRLLRPSPLPSPIITSIISSSQYGGERKSVARWVGWKADIPVASEAGSRRKGAGDVYRNAEEEEATMAGGKGGGGDTYIPSFLSPLLW